MHNIKLIIEYDGTSYNGWQRQNPRRHGHKAIPKRRFKTIQEEIEKTLKKLLKEEVILIGAGRTDAGVHAEAQVANFKTESGLLCKNIRDGLNSLLPKDISIKKAEEVNLDFHSRFDAKGKLYRYRLFNARVRSPLSQRFSTFTPYPLNISKMKSASRVLLGRHNFKAFQSSDKRRTDSIRSLKRLDIVKKDNFVDFYIEADGFLYKMARNIVGTLIEIGRGRLDSIGLKKILLSKFRGAAGSTAPSKGLCLIKVRY